MRQRRWKELIKDYECTTDYHPGKTNVATDALSMNATGSLAYLQIIYLPLMIELRLGACNCSFCFKGLETLSLWYNLSDLHWL